MKGVHHYEYMDKVENKRQTTKTQAEIIEDRAAIANRIDQIISEVNNSNMGGRASNYIGGKVRNCTCKSGRCKKCCGCKGGLIDDTGINGNGNINGAALTKYGKKSAVDRMLHLDYDMVDEDGVLRQMRSAEGYDLDDMVIRPRLNGGKCAGGNAVGGNGIHNETSLSGGKARKKRTDTGKKRGPSEWVQFVKAVQAAEGLSYKQAISMTSRYKKEG